MEVVYERDGQVDIWLYGRRGHIGGVVKIGGWPSKKGVDIVWEAAIDERGRKRQRRPHKGVAKSESGAR
jgi:hypothetical protein